MCVFHVRRESTALILHTHRWVLPSAQDVELHVYLCFLKNRFIAKRECMHVSFLHTYINIDTCKHVYTDGDKGDYAFAFTTMNNECLISFSVPRRSIPFVLGL